MITPQPESDLSLNIMVIAADAIKILKRKAEYVIVDDLLKDFVGADDRRTHELFFNAITFLYTLGIVEEQNYKMRLIHGDTQKNLF
jgi:hypothetical protein